MRRTIARPRRGRRPGAPVAVGAALMLATGVAVAGSPAVPPIVVQVCAACHELDGQSRSDKFPKLAAQQSAYLVKQLFLFKTGQRISTPMQEIANRMSAEEVQDAADYFSRQPVAAGLAADAALAAAGRQLFRDGDQAHGIPACASCHGNDAKGGAQLPRLAGQHAAYLTLQLENFRAGKRGGPWAPMHGVVQHITDAQIRAVTHFLSGLES